MIPKELENIFILNYSIFKASYERPIEFSFLTSIELQHIIEKDDSKDSNINFLGMNFTQNEWKWNIMKKINRNIESMLYDAFLNKLMKLLKLKIEDIYFFRGDLEDWEIFKKKIESKEVALIYNPKIQLKLKKLQLPIELTPGALLYYKNKFSCFLFSNSLRPANIFLSEFTFYYYWFTKFLNLELQDLVIVWKPFKEDEETVTFSFTLPIIKTLTKTSPNKRISIYQALGIKNPEYKTSWFSNFLSQEEYFENSSTTSSLTELEIEKITKSCEILSSEIISRMFQLQDIAKLLLSDLPEEYTVSEWFKKINWKKVITLNSLYNNKNNREKFSFFSSDTPSYRKAISFIFPNYSLLTSPIIPLPKALLLGKLLQENQLEQISSSDSFDFFLSYHFSKKVFKGKVSSTAIFSYEGRERLEEEILSIEWKVYYDFESYLEMLTQTSLQIFQSQNLIAKEDLIYYPEKSYSTFEEDCIFHLAKPILEIISKEELLKSSYEFLYKKLKNKVVYIAFNKTFECQWLKKLSEKMASYDRELHSILSSLMKDLTVDLCDWFVYSRNKSLNLIGELQGTHSLKRLSTKVLKDMKQYSSLEHVQEGRGAQFIFLYYFFIFKYQGFNKELLNDNLSPKYWVIDYKEKLSRIWENIKTHLTEYCSLDVQGMVWAVDWLRVRYENEKLVKRTLILDFISWMKVKNMSEMKYLITDFLNQNNLT